MAKLVFYSGGALSSNRKLHQACVDLAGFERPKHRFRKPLTFTYIPFCDEGADVFFHRFQRRFSAFGAKKFQYLAPDVRVSERDMESAFNTDVVYLAGGNTFYFLKHLRKNGFLPRLKNFVRKGGVLSGLSAGGLIMTPTIALAGHPDLDPDSNDVKLENLKALGLVNFEFSPHYENNKKFMNLHLKVSRHYPRRIVAAEDGAGLVVFRNQIYTSGCVHFFQKGKIHIP